MCGIRHLSRSKARYDSLEPVLARDRGVTFVRDEHAAAELARNGCHQREPVPVSIGARIDQLARSVTQVVGESVEVDECATAQPTW